MMFRMSMVVKFLIVCCVAAASVRAETPGISGVELIKNGSFEKTDQSGFPDDWKFGDPTYNKIETEEGHKFLRFNLPTPEAAITSQRIAIDRGFNRVTIRLRMRAKDLKIGAEPWNTGRVQILFFNAAKERIGNYNAINLTKDQEWSEAESNLETPEGATHIQIECGMWGASGTVDFDDVSVIGKLKELPEGQRLKWNDQPLDHTRTRSAIDLKSEWLFKNAEGDQAEKPTGGWGTLDVPSSAPAGVRRMWYERDIQVPATWAGRRVELDLQRVSTDAKLWVNGQAAGEYAWPGGAVDITPFIKPGAMNTIRLLVVAVDDRAEVEVLMGYATNTKAKAELNARGLIGAVSLNASPLASRVSDVQLRASVTDRKLEVVVEGLASAPKQVSVVVTPIEGGTSVTLKSIGPVASKAPGAAPAYGFAWPDVKLWDVGQPNLYKIVVAVKGNDGLDDELLVPAYGFREFKIDGKQFLLNGTRIHLRPALLGTSSAGSGSNVKKLIESGFNFGEIWPENLSRRGSVVNDDALIADADGAGFLISGNALHMSDFTTDVVKWEDPATQVEYARQMEPMIRRWRNHPSVVMWGTSGNLFQNQADGAPHTLGQRDFISQQEYFNLGKRADVLIQMIKKVDPTRPVFTHFGTYIGDVYTSNMYLNFIPLQEREQWLTHWSKQGQMPFMAVEFGVPFWSTWTRGRDGFGQSGTAEVFLSEWAARYLGKEAYTLEPAEFRKLIAERYIGGTDRRAEYGKLWWWDRKHLIFIQSESFQRVQDLYVTNTWRAWRTLGISGGMVPWDNGMEAAALPKVNGPSLAWIAGPESALLSKDHHFAIDATVEKQVVLINDHRTPQAYSAAWQATIGDAVVGSQTLSGTMEVGQIVKLPITFKSTQPGSGKITLTARIGPDSSEDVLDFVSFAPEPQSKGEWLAFDPKGATTELLKRLGYSVKPWTTGVPPADAVVIVGQSALSGDGHTGQRDLPADLTEFVRSGGRLLVMGQDPDWVRHALHLRVANHVARRVYAVDPLHPIMEGLNEKSLFDWNGAGALVEPYPQYPGYETTLAYGRRNGNQGSVTSAAIEKPHRSSLRPILECEFDLAYSPLMEMEFGEGRVTVCTLDVEARTVTDPAAMKLMRQVLENVRHAPIQPKAKRVIYMGDDAGADSLEKLGVQFVRSTTPQPNDQLLVVGGGAIDEAAVTTWINAGGKAVVLRRTSDESFLGASFIESKSFHGSTAIPDWSETAGLSASDLHFRADTPAWLVAPADFVQVAADGLLARRTLGKGSILFSQLSPDAVPADEKRYFRFTRWRQTRALSQVLANAGATFQQDEQLLKLLHQPDHAWMLAGQWNAIQTTPQPESPRREWRGDSGISEAAKTLIASSNISGGETVPVPAYMESYGPKWRWVDGEVVFKKQIDLPARLAGRDMYWSLGRVDEKETSFINGQQVGTSLHWLLPRGHKINRSVLKAGNNTLSVRLFDSGIHGGLCGDPTHLYLRTLPISEPAFYHEDYIDDGVDESATDVAGWEKALKQRGIADNPYRYYRW